MPAVDDTEAWPRAEPRAVAAAPSAGVDLWLFSLEVAVAERERLHALLDREETARGARFHDSQHRRRFTVAHGRLREIVGAYAGTSPDRLAFAEGPRGKPHLAHGAAALEFNLSHAQHLGLIGVARGSAIGVDIEVMRPMAEMADIAQRNFAPAEFDAWRRLPAEQRSAAFFACWTRKEAVIKATGDGLSMALDRFVVSVHPEQPARLLAIDGSVDAASSWTLASWQPITGVFAAVALRRAAAACRRYRLPGTPGA
jgi:4'-phosphopantetheinyl transferase